MSVISDLRLALKPVCTEMAQDIYAGTADTYLVYNAAVESPSSFSDDEAQTETMYIQVHLYIPKEKNYLSIKQQIKTALVQAGFEYPVVAMNTIETDTCKRHICYETSIESEV